MTSIFYSQLLDISSRVVSFYIYICLLCITSISIRKTWFNVKILHQYKFLYVELSLGSIYFMMSWALDLWMTTQKDNMKAWCIVSQLKSSILNDNVRQFYIHKFFTSYLIQISVKHCINGPNGPIYWRYMLNEFHLISLLNTVRWSYSLHFPC
jgi:hypothetical protein